jgi:putative aminopeptidase FrvX
MNTINRNNANMNLLNQLLDINSVSGNEYKMTQFLVNLVLERKAEWKVTPKIFFGNGFMDCILLKFGCPRAAVFAHIDTIGFMTRYENQLIPVGGPEAIEGTALVGEDELGPIKCQLRIHDDLLYHDFPRGIVPGTYLSFEQKVQTDQDFIQAAYLDNRLGIYNALKLCETLEHGWVVFSTYEEHGGGSMPFLLKFIQETAPISKALISDITWITEGVQHHEGVVISLRDKYIPRRVFVDEIIHHAKNSGIPFQLEVEAYGGSDGKEVQFSPYPIDWCFIGAAEDNVHSPEEKVSLRDLDYMVQLYQYLMKHL